MIVWLSDIAGYFGGQNFKGPKLAPNISPNKTISGSLSALAASFIFAIFAYFVTKDISFYNFVIIHQCRSSRQS